MPQKRLAIISTHPIQYNAPLFQLLSSRNNIKVKVFYTWGESVLNDKYDPGFGKQIKWDIPLLEGYEYKFLKNISKNPGSHHFKGIQNPDIISEIEMYQPSAILVFGWSYRSHLKVLRHFKGRVPILFRGDSTLLDDTSAFKKLLRKLCLTWVYKHIDYALYVGTNNKAYFLNSGVATNKLKLVPHAVDNKRFEQLKDNSAAILVRRRELGFEKDDLVLLFAGKLESKKDPKALFELMKSMDAANLKLLIAGDGDLYAEIIHLSKSDKRIKCIGFQNQSLMPAVYQMSDILILPSKGPGETWGLALNEAMAAGCSVIASSKVGGAIDLIKPGINGFIFQNDIKESTGFINKLLLSKDLLQDAKQYSVKIISQFTLEINAQIIESLCLEIGLN